MKRIFDNPGNLPILILKSRLGDAAEIDPYDVQTLDGRTVHYVGIDSLLPDAQIESRLTTPATTDELAVISRSDNSRQNAKNIPNWATWDEATAQAWGETNIGTPLAQGRTNLPVTLTLATTRLAILQIITILDAMWTMQWALARMVIALRDKQWPDLPNSGGLK
jgi:hypothetical protein